MYDRWGIISDKDSPVDARNQIYEFMMKYRTVYDDHEHKEYLKALRK